MLFFYLGISPLKLIVVVADVQAGAACETIAFYVNFIFFRFVRRMRYHEPLIYFPLFVIFRYARVCSRV